jgi:hypothetical protein
MKRLLFISFILLISLSVKAQKVSIKIIQTKNQAVTDWQVLDDQNVTAFSGKEFLTADSVLFTLEANKLYFLKVSVSDSIGTKTGFLTLFLNGEPLLYIKSDVGKGDHLFAFFTGVKKLNAKITGGTSALIADYPWQVYFISGNFRCGGSIIGSTWVVTAAHCTKDEAGAAIPVSTMFVQVGANDPVNKPLDGKTYAVSEAIVNEGYNDQTLLNDIALLRLQDTINFANAKPIKFVTSDDVAEGAIVPGVMSTVTGWGYTHVNPNVRPAALQKVQLPIVSTDVATTVWGTIPATDLMAGFLNGNKDACNGDSGGPLVVPILDEFKLAGIVSWGSSNCNTYGAYTRISDFETWIRTKTGIAKDFKPPTPQGDSIICQGTESSQYSVPDVTGATAYEWNLLPTEAGVITGNGTNASIIWNLSYIGSVNIIFRVTINNVVSDWARKDGNIVPNTRLLSQSGDTTLCAGQPVTLEVNPEGYNLTYTWSKDNQIVQTGASRKLVYTSSTADESGVYKCLINGSCGTVTSTSLLLTIYPVTKITNVSKNSEVLFGNDVTLNVSSEGHDLVYQWQKDGIAIGNSNTSALFLQNTNATDIGLYKVTVTGTCGVDVSDSIYVYVKRTNYTEDPQVFVWPSVTTGEFTIALNNDAFYNVHVFNTTGLKIREILNCRYQTSMNISTLAKGVYIIEVYNNDFRRSIKVIKN